MLGRVMPRVVVEILFFTPNLLDLIYTFPDLKDDDLEIFFLGKATNNSIKVIELFLTEKEDRDRKTSLELRAKGVITTLGSLFALSRRVEINGLIARGVFKIIPRNPLEVRNTRIFGSRIVDKVKGKETLTLYEKSRLVIQAFNNQGKKTILI